jgi:hypothetical protein
MVTGLIKATVYVQSCNPLLAFEFSVAKKPGNLPRGFL